ncbi:MAG: energy transducer TonB [Proteobacteria bacterium]|nr:energy transducer TonB [Pseudomonadota bacterium]
MDGAWGKDNKSILKPRRNKDFPVMAHHNGIDGSTTILLHLDRSGWVCLVEVIRSTGFKVMDSTMMQYIGQQRYRPALHDSCRSKPWPSCRCLRSGPGLYPLVTARQPTKRPDGRSQ